MALNTKSGNEYLVWYAYRIAGQMFAILKNPKSNGYVTAIQGDTTNRWHLLPRKQNVLKTKEAALAGLLTELELWFDQ